LQLTNTASAVKTPAYNRPHENAQEVRPAVEDLCPLRTTVQLAQEMEARLGAGEILFGALLPRIASVTNLTHHIVENHLVF
jgi:hypothetical protein